MHRHPLALTLLATVCAMGLGHVSAIGGSRLRAVGDLVDVGTGQVVGEAEVVFGTLHISYSLKAKGVLPGVSFMDGCSFIKSDGTEYGPGLTGQGGASSANGKLKLSYELNDTLIPGLANFEYALVHAETSEGGGQVLEARVYFR